MNYESDNQQIAAQRLQQAAQADQKAALERIARAQTGSILGMRELTDIPAVFQKAQASQGGPKSEVQLHMQRLEQSLEQLAPQLSHLRDLLRSIMRPAAPGSEKEASEPSPVTELAGWLQSRTAQVNDLNRLVSEIINRVEAP